MSYVISRQRGNIFQLYCSPDIYGHGKWLAKGEGNWWDLPMEFRFKSWGEARMENEKEKDPDWDYSVDFYDR